MILWINHQLLFIYIFLPVKMHGIKIMARPPPFSPHRVPHDMMATTVDCSGMEPRWQDLHPRWILDVPDENGLMARNLEVFSAYITMRPTWNHMDGAGRPTAIWQQWKRGGFGRDYPHPSTRPLTWTQAWLGRPLDRKATMDYIDHIYATRVCDTAAFRDLVEIYKMNDVVLMDLFPLQDTYNLWPGEWYVPGSTVPKSYHSHTYKLAELLYNSVHGENHNSVKK